MTVVRINAIAVAPQMGEELARRFAARAGAVDRAEGFEGFELLRPTDGRDTWLVVTRWRDDASFRAWAASPAFAHGHRGAAEAEPGADGVGHAGGDAAGSAGGAGGAAGAGADAPRPPTLATASELWCYDVVDLSGG